MSHPQVRCVTNRLRRSTVADLQSWLNVLGHFALLPANIWSLCPPPSHPGHNDDDVASSKVDPLSQHCFGGEAAPENCIMTSHFIIMRHQLTFCQVSQRRLAGIVQMRLFKKTLYYLETYLCYRFCTDT